MKIYAICVVKNEVDIIAYSLSHAARWADKVIVYDNGSTDGTWEKVQGMEDDKIVAYRSEQRPYSDGLRATVFQAFKNELSDGDWWVIQDADEVYDISPRTFIINQSGSFHHINGKKIDFCFDLNSLRDIDFSGNFFSDVNLFDHYTPIAWSEPRIIRHRSKMEWTQAAIWPKHMGVVCQNTINIRHYPLRSREQIRKRWETRKHVSVSGGQFFSHWEKNNWEEYYITKAMEQRRIAGSENIFDVVPFANEYRQNRLRTAVKSFLHRLGIFK